MSQKVFIIRAPFLRRFTAFYGHFGLHLRPVSRADPASLFSLLTNSLLIVLLNTLLFLLKPKQDSYQFVHRQKPLYALELKSIGLITPHVFNFCMVYFLLRGGLIVRLLDFSCFHLPETKKHLSPFITSQWSLPVLFVVDHVAFVCVFTHYIYVFDYNKRAFFGIIMYFTQIVPSVLFRLTAYYKYLTWKALQSIAEQHTGKVVTGQKIANKVAELAILNKQLNSLFSPPLLLFTVFHSMQSLTLLVGMFSQGFQAAGLIIPLPIFTAAGGIVYFCKQIENSLSRIQSGDCFVVSKSNRCYRLFNRRFRIRRSPPIAAILQLHQLSLTYGRHFQLQIFIFYTFSSSSLIALAMLILNFAVLLNQTK